MVADLEFDRNGVLWMAVTGEGVFSYNLKTDELLHYVYRNGESGISNNNVNSIFCDSENKLWFATSGSGLDCLDGRQIPSVTMIWQVTVFLATVYIKFVKESVGSY